MLAADQSMISGVRCWPRSSNILTRFPLSAPNPVLYLMLVWRLKQPHPCCHHSWSVRDKCVCLLICACHLNKNNHKYIIINLCRRDHVELMQLNPHLNVPASKNHLNHLPISIFKYCIYSLGKCLEPFCYSITVFF